MANRSTPSERIIIDPLFSIPDGAEDQFVLSQDGTDLDGFSDGEVEFIEGSDDSSEDGDELEVPEILAVTDQKIRRVHGGQQMVVDVVIVVEDVEGAKNYEIQVTKI